MFKTRRGIATLIHIFSSLVMIGALTRTFLVTGFLDGAVGCSIGLMFSLLLLHIAYHIRDSID